MVTQACPPLSLILQQSLGDKRLAKGQTLTYINGYQREDALAEVKDLPPRAEGTAGSPAQSPQATATYSPSKSGMFADVPAKLPQWVENDRKVGCLSALRGLHQSSCFPIWKTTCEDSRPSFPLFFHPGPPLLCLLQGGSGGEQRRESPHPQGHPVLLLRGRQHACSRAATRQQWHATGR